MRELELEVESAQLARSLSNVLAFVGARCIFPWVRLTLSPNEIIATGGDLYAFGTDYIETSDPTAWEAPRRGLDAILTRPDAQALEKLARTDKKGYGTVRTVGPGPSGDWLVKFTPNDSELEPASWIAYGAGDLESKPTVEGDQRSVFTPANYFEQVDDLLGTLEERTASWPMARPLAFTPDILSRFSKVKRHDSEPTIMDCWISSPDEPILVKIGPRFTGAIQPVLRSVYVRNNPDADGLWDDDDDTEKVAA